MSTSPSPSPSTDKKKIFDEPLSPVLTPKQQNFFQEVVQSLDKIASAKSINQTITLQTLNAIFSNILEHSLDPKYRRISITNQKFQKRVLQASSGAVKLLELVGFKVKEGYFVVENYREDQFKMVLAEVNRRLDLSLEARANWKNVISQVKVLSGINSLMKKISLKSLMEKNEPTTVEINGKTLTRPILRTFHVKKDNAVFEVSEQYEVKEVLGFGAYGLVVLAYDTIRNKNVAIKKIFNTFSQDFEYQKRILREIMLMVHFQQINDGKGHPNIINIIDIIPPRSYANFHDIYIVMDCMEQDMAKLIRSREPLSNDNIMYFMYSMLCGLYGIHSANVLHRDLKPSNVLIDKDMNVRICDFGLARGLDKNVDSHMSTLYVVTRWYRSPELCLEWEESYKPLDMWSMGCILAELIQKPTRKPLFPGDSTLKQITLILDICGKQKDEDVKGVQNAKLYVQKTGKKEKVDYKTYPKFRHVTDESCLDLLDKLLQFNPDKRITVEEALHHPYFKEIYDPEDVIKIPTFDFNLETESDDTDFVKKLMYESIMQFNAIRGIGGDAILSSLSEVNVE
jgi:serine/threonine protein kinase